MKRFKLRLKQPQSGILNTPNAIGLQFEASDIHAATEFASAIEGVLQGRKAYFEPNWSSSVEELE